MSPTQPEQAGERAPHDPRQHLSDAPSTPNGAAGTGTPRTDAAALWPASNDDSDRPDPKGAYVDVGFTRTLERELNEAKEAIKDRESEIGVLMEKGHVRAELVAVLTAERDRLRQTHLDCIDELSAQANLMNTLRAQLTAMTAERDRLGRFHDDLTRELTAAEGDDLLEVVRTLRQQNEALRKEGEADKARLDWLEKNPGTRFGLMRPLDDDQDRRTVIFVMDQMKSVYCRSIRATLDAASAAQQAEGKRGEGA